MIVVGFRQLFRHQNKNAYEQDLIDKRAKLIAPVTQYYGKKHKKVKYFVNYKGFRDYDDNPRLIHVGKGEG